MTTSSLLEPRVYNSRTIIRRHALKNALIPFVTIIGLQVGLLFGGAVITETILLDPWHGTVGR